MFIVTEYAALNGVNRRSENFLLLSDLLFAREGCTRGRYKTCRNSCCFGLCIWAPLGFWGSGENGYLFSGSWGALVIILGELRRRLIVLGI